MSAPFAVLDQHESDHHQGGDDLQRHHQVQQQIHASRLRVLFFCQRGRRRGGQDAARQMAAKSPAFNGRAADQPAVDVGPVRTADVALSALTLPP
jgi:hypothetical protein